MGEGIKEQMVCLVKARCDACNHIELFERWEPPNAMFEAGCSVCGDLKSFSTIEWKEVTDKEATELIDSLFG